MTIKEWKDEFAKLYLKMKEDIGVDHMEINIYAKGNAFHNAVKVEIII